MSALFRTAAAVALIVAASASASCGKSGHEEPIPAAQAELPVPTPDGLLADVYVGAPNAAWSRLQRGAGGAAGILPATVGGLVAMGFGIDPVFAGEIDGVAPAFAVLVGDPVDPGWALAVKVHDVRRARGLMVDGDTARFAAREVAAMTELVPRGAPSRSAGGAAATALALTRGGYLVAAKSSADLERLGPYVSRTMPRRTLPTDGSAVVDVPRSALDGSLRPKLEGAWADAKKFMLDTDLAARQAHGGRAPDFGDPKPVVSAVDAIVQRRIAVLGDLERLRVAFEIGDEGASLLATMTPATADGAASRWVSGMRTGDAADVLAMPSSSALALVTRDTDTDRDDQGKELERTLTSSLGPRLASADAKRLHAVVEDWTSARGETIGFSLDLDEPRGVFIRGAVKDGQAAGRAVSGLLELARVSPFKDALRVKDVVTTTDDAPPLGKVSVATISRDESAPAQRRGPSDAGAPRAKPATKSVGLAWVVDGSALDLSTGTEPVLTLRHGAKPDKRLGDEPSVMSAVAPLGGRASTIVVAQPLRFDPTRANLPIAPVVLGVGRKDKDAFVRVQIANGLLRELTRLAMGF